MATNYKILVIVPAFNEEGNIKKTIEEISSLNLPLSILVINDGSKDGTLNEVNKTSALIISLPFNLGIGGAVQTGFKYASEKNYDIAVQIDGDGQHDVKFLEKILRPIIAGEADLVIGSRFMSMNQGFKSSFLRRMGISFFSYLISFIIHKKITDPTSGFRAYNKKIIKIFSNYYPHDFPEPEAIVVAQRYNAKIKEVPVEMRKRLTGNSSIRYLRTFYYMVKVTFAIMLDKLKSRKDNN